MSQDDNDMIPDKELLEWRKARDLFYEIIRNMRQEYIEEHKGIYDSSRPSVDQWANEKYGFQMVTDIQGNYIAEYTVTDPKKFMLFKIRYWK